MNTIPAQEIKRGGISAVDAALSLGPVHVIKNNRPQYVALSESTYQELIESQQHSVALNPHSMMHKKAVLLNTKV